MPEPLTPPDCDLRDFSYMPLDVARLRDSEAAVVLSDAEFRAAIMLWCAAWHQVPAASLPADDRLLASLAGYGRDRSKWKKVKDGALRGFIECSDGRLYHPVISEKAAEAHQKRRTQSKRTEAATAAAAAVAAKKRSENNKSAIRNGAATDDVTEPVADTKGIEGKGEEGKMDAAARAKYLAEIVTSGPEDCLMAPAWKQTVGYTLAKAVAGIAGRAAEFEMTGWGGAAERAQVWLDAEGWTEERILASVREQAGRMPSAPNSISYFEKGIAEHVARINASLPTTNYSSKAQVYRGSKNSEGIIAIADKFIEYTRKLAEPPAICGGESADHVRLVSQRRGE